MVTLSDVLPSGQVPLPIMGHVVLVHSFDVEWAANLLVGRLGKGS